MPFLRDTLRRVCCCICPSYTRNSNDVAVQPRPTLRPTAALDGLRGLAALSVLFSHILFSYTDSMEYGYGQSEKNELFIQLPFVKLAYSGHAMVTVFFVVGGYVMSIKPLKLIHTRQNLSFHNALVSSVFRRSFRLYIPAIVISFITMLSLYVGLWEYPRQFITEDRQYVRFDDHHIPRMETLWLQFMNWIHEIKNLTNVFNYYNNGIMMPYYPPYDPHLWTIPVEYRSGMLLGLILLCFARCRVGIRMVLMFLAILFVGMWERWELVCFLSGSLLCEIDLVTGAGSVSSSSDIIETEPKYTALLDSPDSLPSYWPYAPTTTSSQSLLSRISFINTPSTLSRLVPYAAFMLGLYLLSAPCLEMATTPGYMFISTLIPYSYTDPKRFPFTLGTLLVVYGIMRSATLRAPFLAPFPQYLGKISFALYVVHGPLIHVVGLSVTPTIWARFTGMETPIQWVLGLLLGSTVLVICVMVAADLFWRTVETWSINVARRVEGWCFESLE
jgi:peptidoglycan/LPS O-acetylase OafA/YrhL